MTNTIKLITIKTAIISSFLILLPLISCSSGDRDDIIDSIPEHEHDEISKIVLQFREINNLSVIREFSYEVPEGTTQLPITNIDLPAGEYNVETFFYAPHGDHYHDVTDEIFIEDADDHFVFYQKLNAPNINIKYSEDDRIDTLGRKLGHKTIWNISAGAAAGVYLYLIHQPAVKNPDALSTEQLGGEIDLEAHFNITVTE